jgi:hypothetical protein
MKTFTQLTNNYTDLSNNTSTTNSTRGQGLINDYHRYLIQKYFDNERTATMTTVGGTSLTLTGALAIGATTATLDAVWAYPTYTQLVNFSSGQQRSVLFTYNSAAISWSDALTSIATTAISTVGVQDYPIPANVSKIKNNTINVGQIKYQPTPIMTRAEWDMVNMLPYTSDIPNYFYIYGGKFSVFPIPSTTGNIMSFNYKTRVADLSYTDVTANTLATMTAGSTTVTGTSTTWNTVFPVGVDISSQNLHIRADVSTGGDGIWYPIRQFNSATSLTLSVPVVSAPNISASTTYTIGQLPLLSEDFADMLIYGALMTYFGSIQKDTDSFNKYEKLYKERLVLLEDYAGTKTVNVDLGAEPATVNPNLFYYSNTNTNLP